MDILTNTFWIEGLAIANHNATNSKLTGYRKYRTFYGVSPEVCSMLWNRILQKPSGAQPKHLLWSLLFLKNYNKEHVNAALVLADEKTFRLWSWRFVTLISQLEVVSSKEICTFIQQSSYDLSLGTMG